MKPLSTACRSMLASLLLSTSLAGAAQPPRPATQVAATGETIICKRFTEAGSLVRKRKICLTRDEWSQLSEAAQRNVEYLQFQNMGGNDGCKPSAPGC